MNRVKHIVFLILMRCYILIHRTVGFWMFLRFLLDSRGQVGSVSSVSYSTVTLMDTSFQVMVLRYMAAFERPAFELCDCSATLMRSLYQKLSSRFDLDLNDMHSFEGGSMLNTRIEIDLFSGDGRIRLDPSALLLNFKDIRSREELDICMECISLSRDAFQASLPNVGIGNVVFAQTLENQVDDKTLSVHKYLSHVAGNEISMKLDAETFGNVSQYSQISIEVEDANAEWDAVFNVTRSPDDISSVLVSCDAFYNAQSTYAEPKAQADHLDRLLKAFLASIDMRIRWDTGQ